MKKIVFYLLLALNFILPLAIISNSFDGDLGWHLRFGQDFVTNHFPYLDIYTYSKYGSPWTNHEWGGDWLFWHIYSKVGYWWLNLITSLAITFAFLISGKTFYKKINSNFLFFSLLCQWSITHILVARLAMFTPLFAALTFFIIEKAKSDFRWFYLTPPLFWIWSAIHGSWILGFIILNLYLGANLLISFCKKMNFTLLQKEVVPKYFNYKIIFVQIVSAILITANPYGFKIWTEIFQYFGQNYYKLHTTEWLPSYTYPIFWKILVIQTIALVFVIYGFLKNKTSLTHSMIFLAFFYTAINYKRQAIFVGLLSAVVFSFTFEFVQTEILKIKFFNGIIKKSFYFFSISTLVLLLIYYSFNIHLTKDIWQDKMLAEKNSLPYEAVGYLKKIPVQPSKLFNNFNWGGYLNWTLPDTLIYFDGRGTATWMYDKKVSMLEHYHQILEQPNGLSEIQNDQVNYILLQRTGYIPTAKPDSVNNWIFGKDDILDNYLKPTQLQTDLEKSSNWKKVYSDKQAVIWQNISLEPK